MSMIQLRDQLRAASVPDGAPWVKKEFVEQFLVRACDLIAIDHRDPDAWELQHFLAAVGAVAAQRYDLAATYAEKGMAPPEDRAEEWRGRASGMSRPELERAIQLVRVQPAPAG